MRAVEGGHSLVVKALLGGGAEAARANDRGLTALHLAAAVGGGDLFAVLVGAGAEVQQT
jgi:ankyrin repeat protein